MISVPLDPKQLLGFKLIEQAPAQPSSAITGKVGTKEMSSRNGVRLGAKVGGKAGVKANSQLGAKVGTKFGFKTSPASRG